MVLGWWTTREMKRGIAVIAAVTFALNAPGYVPEFLQSVSGGDGVVAAGIAVGAVVGSLAAGALICGFFKAAGNLLERLGVLAPVDEERAA